ncbi:3-hydroxybutyrate dehydrogenase [Kordiimonas pumila]|uniref:3-hydroxybutyrate dehydrogenase n=1 Tax=Kordiimonas pumila TaxID=2161677 RepID=A0ABV7D808_9PROT|nr:3-hydroxybutyrate dehydrogenase [Kordiimonas pumila]
MLQGKTAVITGSTSGIGLGIAHRLAQEGVNIVLNGFGDRAAIDAVQKHIATTYDVDVVYNGADVSKVHEIEALFTDAIEKFGSVDILVNNAGIQHVAPVEEMPVEKWDAIIAINLSSSFHTIRLAVPAMKKAGWGRIVNIASAHALSASPFKSAYVAAKHGIAGLTKTVALELAEHKITCNALCPGYVLTDLVEGQIADTAKARNISKEDVVKNVMLSAQPTKEFVTIEQVSEFTAYLCSDSARSITGAMLSIDGGWSAK